MKENEVSEILMNKLDELNDLEIAKSKVYAVIFQKNTNDIIDKKIQVLKSNFDEQAKYYNQDIESHYSFYNESLNKYKEQLVQIINKYNELYINIYLELQEAQCNQKISLANILHSYNIKQSILEKADDELIEEYNKKINACINKKINYDYIIKECENELDSCIDNINIQINNIFGDKSSQICLSDTGMFSKLINKIKNIFIGKGSFDKYFIKPLKMELENIDGDVLSITNSLNKETINWVAKVRKAKEETNKIFEKMM